MNGALTDASRTPWGGIGGDRRRASGFFQTASVDGVWWLIDPDGGRFLSKGVNTVRFDQDQVQGTSRIPYAEACRRKYGNEQAWRAAAASRLRSWGFNSLGAWSDERVAGTDLAPLASAPILHISSEFLSRRHKGGEPWPMFPDVFDPEYEAFAATRARDRCASRRDDPGILGWFIDNELRWGPDWRGQGELLTAFLNLDAGSPGRRAALASLRARYADFDAFRAVWASAARSWSELAQIAVVGPVVGSTGTDRSGHERDASGPLRAAFEADCDSFAGAVAQRYFAVTAGAVKAADPNHLVLGCRFATVPRRSVIAEAARHVDVISLNCYEADAVHTLDAYALSGKPCLIGEFSFRAEDSGLPNTRGGGLLLPTQSDRARCVERYVGAALARPELIGYHWFEHADQPAQGRFDGEDSNYGLVTIEDTEYGELTRAMTALNAGAEAMHATSGAGSEAARSPAGSVVAAGWPGARGPGTGPPTG